MPFGLTRGGVGAEGIWKPVPSLAAVGCTVRGASFVLGHNVIDHDLPILREHLPGMALHALPVIDTLRLSPLAFPQNPYHRLIKDYKLVRDSLNSPLSDCRSTLVLFQDQRQAFTQLNEINQMELLCYQALLTPSMRRPGSFLRILDWAVSGICTRAQNAGSAIAARDGSFSTAGFEGMSGTTGATARRRSSRGRIALVTGLCVGLAPGIWRQLGVSALGSTPVSGGWTVNLRAT